MLPGFPDLETFRVDLTCAASGRSLTQIRLRSRSGATVMAIQRQHTPDTSPNPTSPLQAGDTLALAGTPEAIARAREILRHG